VSNEATATTAVRPETSRRGPRFPRRMALSGYASAFAQPATYLGVAMLAVVYVVVAFLFVSGRQEAANAAQRNGENIVRIIDESYSNVFQNIDSSLQYVRRAYQGSPSTFNMSDWVQEAAIRNNLAFNFVITDARGLVINEGRTVAETNVTSVIGIEIGDHDFFVQQANASVDSLAVSPPLALNASLGPVIALSRRMTAPDGSFAGVVSALIKPIALARAVASIDLGAGGTFGLVGLDGIVRLRVQDGKLDQNAGGMKLQPGTGVLAHVNHARTGTFWTLGLIDRVQRLISYRVLESYPLIATVSATEAEIFRHTDEAERTYWAIALLLTIAIAAAIRWAAAREHKLNTAVAEMKQAQERYELVETAVHDGIWDKNILTGATYFSPRWFCNLGYAEGEVSKSEQAFFDLIHPADKASVEKRRREYLEGQSDQVHAIEFRLRHKDGSYRWIQGRGKALRDANGRPLRMLGTITDITERKQTQAAIEETNVRLARAEAMAHLGHIKYEKASGLYTWSDGIYRIMGKFPDSFTPTLELA